MKRIAGVLKYHMLTVKWPMIAFMAIMVAVYSISFIGSMFFIVDDLIGPMNAMRVESHVLSLGNEIEEGFVPSCFIFVFVSIILMAGRDQRTLIPLSITRKEMMIGNTVFLLVQSLIMITFIYAASVLARLVLNISFMADLGGMRPLWVLGGDGATLINRFIYTLAYMIGMSGPVLLFGCMMTRWKKQILFLLGLGFVVLILLFVRGDWLRFFADSAGVQTLFDNVMRVFNWIKGYYADGGVWLVTLKQLLIYAVTMALCYPVVRWTRIVK